MQEDPSNKNLEEKSEQDLISHQSVVVDPHQEPTRIDKFLMTKLQKVSRNRIQNAIRAGAITVDKKTIKPNFKIKGGHTIDMVFPKFHDDGDIPHADNIPLDIVYEDDYLLVVNKKAGMVVHPGVGNPRNTLVNALRFYFQDKELPTMEGNNPNQVGLVHRIDKETSGLLVIAKTEFAMSHLAKQFFDHSIERSYQAIVWGEPNPSEGTVNVHIGRNPKHRILRHAFPDGSEGKHAITHYKMLEDMYYVSLIECKLETGRTHQIRVHMNYLGNPLFNDKRYGGDRVRKGTIYSKYKQFVDNCFKLCSRHALHAKSLGFIHPHTEEKMFFDSPLPEDMASCLNQWRTYVADKRFKKGL